MKYNKTAIATFISVALGTASLGVAANGSQNEPSLKSVANVLSNNTVAKRQIATASGMDNHYDNQLGQYTFQWASKTQKKPNLSIVKAEHKAQAAADFYLNQLTGANKSKVASVQAVLANMHDQKRGALVAKYKQEVAGIEVFNREYNIMMDQEFNLVASSGYFASTVKLSALSSGQGFVETATAIEKAFSAMGGKVNTISLKAHGESGKYEQFVAENFADDKKILGQPRAKKVFFDVKGELVPAHYVELEVSNEDSVDSDYFSFVISSKTGEVLLKNNLTSHAADFNYRVYADVDGINKPWDGPHGNVIPAASIDQEDTNEYLAAPLVSLSAGPISTKDAWLADDATETIGNNVRAYVDAIAPDGYTNGDFTAEITSANTFDYQYDSEQTENSMHNRKAAIVNLFYMNNFLHDWFYDHGFDEASGNAQLVNYGRGGIEGDPLRAEVQDNSGFNNANMSTPADGYSPRMQMYLWDSKDAVNGTDYGIKVSSHSDIGLLESTRRSAFGMGQFSVAGNLVRLTDGFEDVDAGNTTTDGCEEAINGDMLAGNIAIIDRGACNFTQKVLHAQNAGAVAVLIANNRDGDVPAPMGGSDDAVKIPNMGISQNEGAEIYALLDADETVSIEMFNNKPYKASSWDNGIVAHEWGHYISNRLVGNSSGLINNQGGSLGEGWGDFHALMLLANAEDAAQAGNELYQKPYSATSYVASFTKGIRAYPYSTNKEVSPYTFADITADPEVHGSGSVWASMLWDAYVALINDERYTFAQAESRMMDYLVAGYKMTPIAPTFTEARDAILAAAYANDVDDYKLMLAAFAGRGLGLGAVSPSRYSTDHLGVVESYETELATFTVDSHNLNVNYEGLTSGYCSNDNILDNTETATVSFTVKNGGSEVLTGLVGKVEVVSGHDVTFANDGMVSFDDVALFGSATSAPLEFTLNDAMTADTLELKLTFPEVDEAIVADEHSLSTRVHMDFKTRELVGNSMTDDMETVATINDFTEHVMVGGDLAKGTFGLDSTYNWLFPVGEQYTFVKNNGFSSDVAFETKTMHVGYGGDFVISWWQYFEIEETWDGGVVEVSVNGGDWADVTTMGGTFEGLGYTGMIDERAGHALAEKAAYTGFSPWPGGYETLNFGTALNGNEVKFRFRIVSDTNTNEFGWFIDNFSVNNITNSIFSDVVAGDTYACDNRLPTVTISGDESVVEGNSANLSVEAIDPNNDELTYQWTQTSGTEVTLTGADSSAITFTAPNVSATETLTFNVDVNDGTGTVSETMSVTVENKQEPAPVKSKSSSGGSTSWLSLLLLPLALLRRRK
ncbi:rhombosortase-dependent M36 family metallopeptidase [Thalassotalea sp. G2M2-11]|uniref:rhombosortase-dependent M36 family metallopeptidase n=1 Tax=Thalassotalea sp. G2M2-11 TaxID=2787627 RepID=UPI0019D24968|nr:rhombosortase-dependent M36 family metallopeptidase [Thalassotalea sp. G2M2-11]